MLLTKKHHFYVDDSQKGWTILIKGSLTNLVHGSKTTKKYCPPLRLLQKECAFYEATNHHRIGPPGMPHTLKVHMITVL